ncbi:pirin family protein [Serpentinicella sp. ANB-PHB4]|uniref:pirin family protein n=1 Tax=Serpentinicella sp. ANB-PHB4 TaxID=3074076 RepID=UPI00285C6DCA|nr:pirin family protein [Serpentinicella sp. ANB-PHB4]MDR5659479.1 pirin family protein [Serpentinicella sp. ANB-PHB4]
MIKRIDHDNMGKSNLQWLESIFHFSFAEYKNPENINFGVLRVLNDDLIKPGTGFDTHPHKDMEIISYVIDGELTHGDNMGNKRKLSRGHVQYMSAGSGVYHSEHNLGKDTLRILQMWIYPDQQNLKPTYGDYMFKWDERKNKWLHIVSAKDGNAPIKVNQDVNIYVLEIEKGEAINFSIEKGRQLYLVQIEGTSKINSLDINQRDALQAIEENLNIIPKELSHFIVIEMKKA